MVQVQAYADKVWLQKYSYLAIELTDGNRLEGLLLNYTIYDGMLNNVLIDLISGECKIRQLVDGKSIAKIKKLKNASKVPGGYGA